MVCIVRPYLSATASVVAAVNVTVASVVVTYTAVAYWPSVAVQMPLLLYAVFVVAVA